MRTSAPLILTPLLCLSLIACKGSSTYVELTGSLVAGECGELLPWTLPYGTWSDTGEADAVLRFQSDSGPSSHEKDTIVFIINRQGAQEIPTGAPIEVGDREYDDAPASGHITLPVRCPGNLNLAVQLFGELTFDALPRSHGERVVGSFAGDAVDPRSGDVLSSGLLLEFDFERRYQSPWQTWPTPRE